MLLQTHIISLNYLKDNYNCYYNSYNRNNSDTTITLLPTFLIALFQMEIWNMVIKWNMVNLSKKQVKDSWNSLRIDFWIPCIKHVLYHVQRALNHGITIYSMTRHLWWFQKSCHKIDRKRIMKKLLSKLLNNSVNIFHTMDPSKWIVHYYFNNYH